MDYLQLADDVIAKARKKGADQCDCVIEIGSELSIKVRQGGVESIERASVTGLGIRFFVKKALGFGFTTDFSPDSIDDLIKSARDFATTSTPDPEAGIPEFEKTYGPDLEINDPRIDEISLSDKTRLALECEQAAYDYDKRISKTYGTSYNEQNGRVILARVGADPIFYDGTHFNIVCVPVAEDAGQKRMGIWVSSERFLSDLEPPAKIGMIAAGRAVSMLGARTPRTQKASVVFDSRTACEVVENIFDALDGENVLRGMSFLRGKRGLKVGSDLATFIDDGRMARRTGSRPFDGEGTATGRTLAIDKGVLKSYFYDFRSGNKAGCRSTGNARRSFGSIPGVGPNNFYLIPGTAPRDAVIQGVKHGVLVTSLLGFGVNTTTGDFSRGAEGLWIEDGEITYPVDGITIAGNLEEMLKGVVAVASDLRFFGRIGSPTFVVHEMTIAGD